MFRSCRLALALSALALLAPSTAAAALPYFPGEVGKPITGTGTSTATVPGDCDNLRNAGMTWPDGVATTATVSFTGASGDRKSVVFTATHTFTAPVPTAAQRAYVDRVSVNAGVQMTCYDPPRPGETQPRPYLLELDNQYVFDVSAKGKGDDEPSCPSGGVVARLARARAAASGCLLPGVEGRPGFVGGVVPAQCRVANPLVTLQFPGRTRAYPAKDFGPSGGGVFWGEEVVPYRFGDYPGALLYDATCPNPDTGAPEERQASQPYTWHVVDAPIKLHSLREPLGEHDNAAGFVGNVEDTNPYGEREDLAAVIEYGDGDRATAVLGIRRRSRDDAVFFQIYAPAHRMVSGVSLNGPFEATLSVRSVGGSTDELQFALPVKDGVFAGMAPNPFDPAPNPPPEPPAPKAGRETPKPNPNKSIKGDVRVSTGQAAGGWFGGLCSGRIGRLPGVGSLCASHAAEASDGGRAMADPPDPLRARVLPAASTASQVVGAKALACGKAPKARCARARAALRRYISAEQQVAAATTALADSVDRAAGARKLRTRFRAFSTHAQLSQLAAMKAFSGKLATAIAHRNRAGAALAKALRAAKLNVTLTRAQARKLAASLDVARLPAGLVRALSQAGISPNRGVAVLRKTGAKAKGFDLRRFVARRVVTKRLTRFYHSMTTREVAEIQQTLAAGYTIRPKQHRALGKRLERAHRLHGKARRKAMKGYIKAARAVPGPGGALLRYAAAGV